MFYDQEDERFFICENTYQYQKFYVLEYDERRARNGVGNHLTVTIYTVVGTNIVTAEQGRGHRGIHVDAMEANALRNVIHFNCANPFSCNCANQGGSAQQ